MVGRIVAVGVALLIWSGTAQARVSVDEIYTWCLGYPEAARPELCKLYVGSAIALFRKDDRMSNPAMDIEIQLCIPEPTPLKDVVPAFLKWVEDHPQERPQKPGHVLARALQARYPCR
jgi:hypothetical protein